MRWTKKKTGQETTTEEVPYEEPFQGPSAELRSVPRRGNSAGVLRGDVAFYNFKLVSPIHECEA